MGSAAARGGACQRQSLFTLRQLGKRRGFAMTAVNSVTDLSRAGEIAVVTINSPPVHQRHFETAAQRRAVDGGDDRFWAALQDAL